MKLLSYGLPYADDKKYFDYEYLRMRLQSLRSDAVFLKRFASSFYGSPIQASNLAVIREAAGLLEKGIPFYDKLEDRFYTAMQDFIMVELFKYDRDAHDYKTNKDGSLIIQWRRLHDLAMFVINYDRKNSISKPKEEIVTPKPFVKTLEQEKIVYQQLSLFD